jgi:hypothetical protein
MTTPMNELTGNNLLDVFESLLESPDATETHRSIRAVNVFISSITKAQKIEIYAAYGSEAAETEGSDEQWTLWIRKLYSELRLKGRINKLYNALDSADPADKNELIKLITGLEADRRAQQGNLFFDLL